MKKRASRPTRKLPSRGVHLAHGECPIVFVTVCTKNRVPWLANDECHQLLVQTWTDARAWIVGRYVVMPDHVHLFRAPGDMEIDIEKWVGYWKSQISKKISDETHRWQKSCWHTRLRRTRRYAEKWEYVRDNPIRHGLCEHISDWPFQGEIHELRF